MEIDVVVKCTENWTKYAPKKRPLTTMETANAKQLLKLSNKVNKLSTMRCSGRGAV